MSKRPYLSIIVPAYNEEIRLVPTMDRLIEWTNEQTFSTEILVVDDGSKDDTCGLVERYGATHSGIKLLRNGRNRGKGYRRRRTGHRLCTACMRSLPIHEG